MNDEQREVGRGVRIGIVGHEAAKFTPETERAARLLICDIIASNERPTVVSGACHLGGIDIWAISQARAVNLDIHEFRPLTRSWERGYKPRNMAIAEASDEVHCIVVAEYPASYTGMRFGFCYHCGTSDHIKSGGCWTRKYAERIGKKGFTHVIRESAVPGSGESGG